MRTTFLVAALLLSCGSDAGRSNRHNQPSATVLLSPAITSVTIEVDYARGAEPYTGSLGELGDTWGLFQANVARVFQKSPKKLTVPRSLAAMEVLYDVKGSSFTTEQILAIADEHRNAKNVGSAASFYVIWLPGYYRDDGKVLKDVLGVSIGDTGVIAMFKAVVVSATSDQALAKFIEQSTLIHEFGHTIGLVNNGLAVASPHEDKEHQSHCTNSSCAMYWENDGASIADKFARRFNTTGSEVIYGAECLDDIDTLASASKK